MKRSGKKIITAALSGLGLVLIIASLVMDFTKNAGPVSGYMLLAGFLLAILGIFWMPLKSHREIVNIVFLAPMVFTFAVTVLIPFVFGIYYSFTDWDGVDVSKFVGVSNYLNMFTKNHFGYSMLITLLYTFLNMIAVNLVGFVFALLCTMKLRGENFFRSAFFIPNLIGGIVLGYIWQFIFNKVFVMLPWVKNSMLTNANQAFLAILIVSTWQYAGYIMMIYITGLEGVPKDVLEASRVDGAQALTTLLKIKIPMIANVFTVTIFLTLVNSFKTFDLNLAITNGAPVRELADGSLIKKSTELLALNIYDTSIINDKYALGQAMAVIFFIILAIVSLTQVSINKKKEVEL